MVKTFDQPKSQAIIFCPQHGRLENLPDPGYIQDKQGNSHFFHLAYCSQCGVYYTSYQKLSEIDGAAKRRGAPIRTVAPVTPHEAKRIEDARRQAAAQQRKKQLELERSSVETKAAREEWEEIFNPKQMDFGALFAASVGERPRPAAPRKKPSPAPAASAAATAAAPDPYAKPQTRETEQIWLTDGTLSQCPSQDGGALQSANAWLHLAAGGKKGPEDKKLAGRFCPVCGNFYMNEKSFSSLRLEPGRLLTSVAPWSAATVTGDGTDADASADGTAEVLSQPGAENRREEQA